MTCYRTIAITFLALTSSFQSAQAGSIVLGEMKEILPPAATTQTSLECYLERTGLDDGTPLSVGNFQLRVDLAGADAGSSMRILSVGPTTAHPQAFSLDITNVTGGTGAYAATFNLASPFDIADGAGLMKLDLEVQPTATGNYTFSVLSGAGNTEFTSPIDFVTLLPVDVGYGSVRIVPEPSCFYVAALAAIAMWIRNATRTT